MKYEVGDEVRLNDMISGIHDPKKRSIGKIQEDKGDNIYIVSWKDGYKTIYHGSHLELTSSKPKIIEMDGEYDGDI